MSAPANPDDLFTRRSGELLAFHKLAIGARFDDGYVAWRGAQAGTHGWLVYRKTSRSHARCVSQHGYGNERAVGGDYFFAALHAVFPHKETH